MTDPPGPPRGGFEPDPKRYREAAEPHPSPEAAEQAAKDFGDAVIKLRGQYRITDLLVIYTIGLTEADGNEERAMGIFAAGSQDAWESMAAYAYGKEEAARKARIRKLLSAS